MHVPDIEDTVFAEEIWTAEMGSVTHREFIMTGTIGRIIERLVNRRSEQEGDIPIAEPIAYIHVLYYE